MIEVLARLRERKGARVAKWSGIGEGALVLEFPSPTPFAAASLWRTGPLPLPLCGRGRKV
jgi:hypothetical protein